MSRRTTTRKALGDRAEDAVADYLVAHGFSIVSRNLRLGMLELDIVARHEELIVVVEVRTRSTASYTTGLSSLDPKKRARIREAGQRLWDRRYRRDPSAARLRYDVASVTFRGEDAQVEYVPAAFT